MTDNDYNVIKPAEGLQNIRGLAPAKHRDEKKKRQNLNKQNKEQGKLAEDEVNESAEEDLGSEIAKNDQDEHFIDYRA